MHVLVFIQACHHLIVIFSFHNKLNTNPRYLVHQVNRRIDDPVATLLKMEEDLFHQRMTKEVMKDSWDASLKREGSEQHHQGVAIPDSAVKVHA